jgi:hypothetical protein
VTLEFEPNAPASEDQVATVEAELGLRLPAAYRAWVMKTNGCQLFADTPIPSTKEGTSAFSEIDSVDLLPKINRLSGSELIPDEFLRITISDGGSLALKIKRDDLGSVWWASSHEAELEGIVDGPSQEIMHRIADDWDAFLAMDFESD